ncbi:MAG: ABC transporter ATP-binding protein [Clostridium sp.]|uniref:ABC transporter ATP-binding protein n=1 Tax=Clostridium sp. TaxID=1506 RepID=UPI003D6C89F2
MNIEIRNLTKKYSDKVAVNNFSITMQEGVYGLLGPNGAGKTTLIRMLADVLNPSGGEILVDGINKNNMGDEYRSLLGYLPQNMGYYNTFSAQRFLEYVAALKGIKKLEAKEKIDEVLKIAGLINDRKRKVSKFSGGMLRRLGIAQALLNNPKILILDEPTAGLDPQERIRFRNLISNTSKERIVILSTHIVSDIEFIAKKVILIQDGRLLKCSSGDELLKDVNGKVWSVYTDENTAINAENKFKIVNIMRKNKSVELRILCDKIPMENAVEVTPNFEDMYLYYFDKKVEEI